MKKGNKFLFLALMSTMLIGLVGCGSKATSSSASPATSTKPAATTAATATPAAPKEDISLGLAGPFTGDGAVYGKAFKNGAELAVAQYNAKGGYQGRNVKLNYGDDKNDPKEAANVAQKLASDDKNLAIIGHWSSSSVLAGIPIYNRTQVPFITPTGSHPDITKPENEWIFRSVPTTAIETKHNAEFIVKKQGKKNLAILFINSDWGKSEAEFLKKNLEELGAKVVAYESYPPGQGVDFTAALTKIKGAKPDGFIVASVVSDGALIFKQARQIGIDATFFGTATFYADDLLKDKESVEGVFLDALFFPETDSPKGKQFVADYKAKYSVDPGFFDALAYDSTTLVLEALNKGGATRKGIRDALANIHGFEVVTGKADFDANRSDTNKSYVFLQVKNGKFTLVK